ncbi:MAG: hypothetical protein O7G88_14105 [bacterium]|nr:hypothetical protein [bacterium]
MVQQQQEPTTMQCILIGLLTAIFGPMFLAFLGLTMLQEIVNNTRPVHADEFDDDLDLPDDFEERDDTDVWLQPTRGSRGIDLDDDPYGLDKRRN